MKTFQTNTWSINLPDDWEEDHDDEGVTLFNPDGFGALELSAVERDEPVDDGFLEYMAAEHLEAVDFRQHDVDDSGIVFIAFQPGVHPQQELPASVNSILQEF